MPIRIQEIFMVGSYVLKDSTDNVISSNFTINANGTFNGIGHWQNQKIEFVTNVFCGGPATFDKVIIYDPENINNTEVELFIYQRNEEDIIQFFSYKVENSELVLNKSMYTLIKKN